MKVLVEAVGCSFGGILTYEMNLLQRWAADWPADDLRVMLGTGDERVVGVHAYDVTLSRPGVLTRSLAVTRAARRITRSWRPDVVLALGAWHILAFGHHSNKNAEMVLAAWRPLVDDGAVTAATPSLNVLGLSSHHRDEMAARVRPLRLDGFVTLSEYLDEDAFRARMAAAAMILYPSDFEGFGLPVVEAMQLGAPVVVGPDRAVQEVAGGHAFTMREWTPEALATAIRAGFAATPAELDAARAHASTFARSRAVRETRGFLVDLAHCKL